MGDAAAAPEPEKPKGPAEPPAFHFSARMPNINAQDLEVVRLTALFVAKNGRSFMTALSQRETRNYQFDFLRPQHSLYQFFSRLVDQYTELLQANSVDDGKAEKERMDELQHSVRDRFHILGRAKQRAEWVKFQEEQKQKKEEAAEQEKRKSVLPFYITILNPTIKWNTHKSTGTISSSSKPSSSTKRTIKPISPPPLPSTTSNPHLSNKKQ